MWQAFESEGEENSGIREKGSLQGSSPGHSSQTLVTHSYDLNFKLKIVAGAEAVNNNREIAREYGISESMVHKWRNQQHVLFSGELKMTAKRASIGRYQRCLSFVYSFTGFFLHPHFSLAIINREIWKVIFC